MALPAVARGCLPNPFYASRAELAALARALRSSHDYTTFACICAYLDVFACICVCLHVFACTCSYLHVSARICASLRLLTCICAYCSSSFRRQRPHYHSSSTLWSPISSKSHLGQFFLYFLHRLKSTIFLYRYRHAFLRVFFDFVPISGPILASFWHHVGYIFHAFFRITFSMFFLSNSKRFLSPLNMKNMFFP